jgi:phosphate:Na+ symporter
VGVGFVLTSLMQSSSASIALILTAVSGDVVTLDHAAAAVIGANVGSTTTGLLAVIGATPSAKRVAAAHVAFNIITGLGALLLLPVLLEFISWTQGLMGTWLTSASILALFHTMFNVLGVLVVWRLTPRLMRYLRRRFRTRAEDRGEPRFLDKAVAKTPAMALNAMLLELNRMGRMARELIISALESEQRPVPALREDAEAIQMLHGRVSEFAAHLRHEGLSNEGMDLLPDLFLLLQYYGSATGMLVETDSFLQHAKGQGGEELAKDLRDFIGRTGELVHLADPAREGFSSDVLDEAMSNYVVHYNEFKNCILRAGSQEKLAVAEMKAWLETASHIRHMVKHFSKAGKQMHGLLEQRDIDLSSRAVRVPSRG